MRYLPLNDEDRAEMLARIGVGSIDELFADIPKDKRLDQDLELPPRKSEMEVERLLSALLTSYTPYQPEIAQGTLQTIFEFQTQVAALTAMDVANASMYDGSTATVEAVAMARRITKRPKAILSGGFIRIMPRRSAPIRLWLAMMPQWFRQMFLRPKIWKRLLIVKPLASWCRARIFSAISAIFQRSRRL